MKYLPIRILSLIILSVLFCDLSAQVNYSSTTLSGAVPSAIGKYTKAQSSYTFAAGYLSEANVPYSMAIGYNTKSNGYHSFTSGINTLASGSYSTAMCDYNTAYGSRSMAIGYHTIANSEACFALGKYNLGLPNVLFELGNGTSSSNRNNAITVQIGGNVGIGEANPDYGQLQIKPSIADQHHGITLYAGGSTARSYVKSDGGSDYNWFMTRGGIDGKGILITKDGHVGINLSSVPLGYQFAVNGTTQLGDLYSPTGVVGIGTSDVPSGYSLAVDGKIITEEIVVELSEDWPDYIFHHRDQILNLHKLEEYVLTYNHLPGVPSSEEIIKDGISLGKMNALLLRKIEELTLYIIDQNRKIEALENSIKQN